MCVQVLVVNPVFFKYVHDYWTEQHGRYPSTGMLAIIFALHMCDQVSGRGRSLRFQLLTSCITFIYVEQRALIGQYLGSFDDVPEKLR